MMNKRLDKCRKIPVLHYFLILFLPLQLSAQQATLYGTEPAPKIVQYPSPHTAGSYQFAGDTNGVNRTRVKLVTAANVLCYGATSIVLYSDWYKNYPQTNFHFFNDNYEWKQVDKIG